MKKVTKKKATKKTKEVNKAVGERMAVICLVIDIMANPHISEELAYQMFDLIAENGVNNGHA